MKWIKKGKINTISQYSQWAFSHMHKPTAYLLDDNHLRIFFGTRDRNNRTRTTFIDVAPQKPEKIIYKHNRPVLELGNLGTFDDAGVNVSCIIEKDNLLFMFYIGWNTSTTVPCRNSIGLAVSEDNGLNFERCYDGPIMDRTIHEPYFTTAPYVIIENGLWRMWYASGTEWKIINNRPEIRYHIKYAESFDGVTWKRDNISCISPIHSNEAIARPCVLKEKNIYKMWYCFRNLDNFRTNKKNSYRIGYAESSNGIDWIRKDKKVGIDVSENGWDSEMIEYPCVYEYKGKKYILYNGNGFGRSGFGYAVLE